MRKYVLAAVVAIAAASSAEATQFPIGTATIAGLFSPSVAIGPTTSTYSGTGSVFAVTATGGYSGASFGTISGLFDFSDTAGVTFATPIANLLTFSNFVFNLSSVSTISFSKVVNPSNTSVFDISASLYLLGTTSSAIYSSAATSVTLQLNSTGGSAFILSGSLSNPPSNAPAPPPPAVPEPASWAMMLAGFGIMGAYLRRNRRVNVAFG